jgi:hypothetical protein
MAGTSALTSHRGLFLCDVFGPAAATHVGDATAAV